MVAAKVVEVAGVVLFGLSSCGTSITALEERSALTKFDQLVARVDALPYRRPTVVNNLTNLARGDALRKATIAEFALQTRAFLLRPAFELAEQFLDFKRKHGSRIEKSFYNRLEVDYFISRLLQKRPIVFMDSSDVFMLKNGERGSGGANFPRIGTPSEQSPLVLQSYISYDEMQISSLLGISVPSYFINDGGRSNNALPGISSEFEEEGVVIDQTGCRFERPELMEWKHMVVDERQNVPGKGYGPVAMRNESLNDLWAVFYGLEYFPTYEEAVVASEKPGQQDLWLKTRDGFLNVWVFRARYRYMAEAFLSECSDWGTRKGSGAYCHVQESIEREPWWTIDNRQALWLLESFRDVLQKGRFPSARVIDFSRFNPVYFKQVFGEEGLLWGPDALSIDVRSTQREPAAKLTGKYAGLYVVYTFAGDSNAYPGNEYWLGALTSSADPAASCMSLNPWLQNPDVNFESLSGDNARVIDSQSGTLRTANYVAYI